MKSVAAGSDSGDALRARARLRGFAILVQDGEADAREILGADYEDDCRLVAGNAALALNARQDFAQTLPPDVLRELAAHYPPLGTAPRINGSATNCAFPEPINLLKELAAPPLSSSDVPRVIGDYAEQFARAAGFDATGAIAAGAVVFAAAVDDRIRVILPGASGHFESARLWSALVGSPGTGKSPMQRAMLAPIYELHREIVQAAAASERARAAMPGAAKEGERVPARALVTSDCTIDKMSELLMDNPRGILYTVDEFDSWIGQHEAFGRDGGSRNRGEWMRLYDGGPHQVDRVSRGRVFVPNWGASVLTATTPAALKRHAKKLSADGLFQRFLVFAARSSTERDETIPRLGVDAARRDFEARVRAVYAQAADLVEKPVVRLSGEAAELYASEERRLRLLVESAEAISESFAGHVAKHAGMLARVALTFHAASDDLLGADGPRHPCAANISGDTMRLAIRFIGRAYQHAYAIYTGCLGGGSAHELARSIALSILADEMHSFNRREISHACRAFRSPNEWQRSEALRTLEDFAWIEPEDFLPEKHGGRWTVNPRVHELFAAEADRARERRTAVRTSLRAYADDAGRNA
jgi:hypothetical protein